MPDVISLNSFYQEMKDTSLRLGYQFQVTIEQLDNLQFFATATTLPGKTINPIEVPYFGQMFRVGTNSDYGGDWTITARCDTDMKLRKAVEKWMDEFSDLSKNGGGNKGIPDYTARIDLLDNELQSINKTYVLAGVWPSTLGEISLDQTAADIAVFDIGLVFQYWYDESEQNPL